jgi:hypothetical protein
MTVPSRTLVALVVALVAIIATSAAAAATPAPRLVTFRSGIVVPNGNYLLTLNTKGRGTIVFGGKRRDVTLPSKILRQLKQQLQAAHFSALNAHYRHVPRPITGIDGASVTYHGRTVTVAAGATAPKALDQLISTLRALALKLN